MSNRTASCTMAALALLLATATSQARWMTPSTGRFQTMDTFEGNRQEPRSLHRYLYAADNPVNLLDPSGNLVEEQLETAYVRTIMVDLVGNAIQVAARQAAIRTLAKVAAVAAITTLSATPTGLEQTPAPTPVTAPQPQPLGQIPAIDFADQDNKDQDVVRGGVATATQLTEGTTDLVPAENMGLKSGFSVQSAPRTQWPELARGGRYKNKQVSVTTLNSLLAAGTTVGYNLHVVPNPSPLSDYHCTVDAPNPLPPRLATALEAVFMPKPNPYPVIQQK